MVRQLLIALLIILPFVTLSQKGEDVQEFYFNSGDTLLTNYSQRKLNRFIEKAIETPYYITKLKVYSDTIGSLEYNQRLSERRLKAIARQLLPLMADYTSEVVLGKQYDLIKYPVEDLQKWRRVEIYYQLTPIEKVDTDTVPLVLVDTLSVEDSVALNIDVEPIVEEIAVSIKSVFDSLPGELFNQPIKLDIQFLTNTDVLLTKSYGEIRALADYLKRNPEVNALIRGHVCCAPNMKISKKRAKKVYKALITAGIPKKRLKFKGMSNTEPAVFPEESESDRQKNRRVDVIFSPRP
jgi:outer membrane protein OmpA-like peptidoglycan-associated protein